MSVLGLVYRSSRVKVDALGRIEGEKAAWGSLTNHAERRTVPGILVLRLDSPVFWVNAMTCQDEVLAHVDEATGVRVVIIDMEATNVLDTTSADMLNEMVETLHTRDIDVYFVRVRYPVRERCAGRVSCPRSARTTSGTPSLRSEMGPRRPRHRRETRAGSGPRPEPRAHPTVGRGRVRPPVEPLRPVTLTPLLPGLASLRGYQRGWLRGDVIAGITVAAYAVPQVMAYAELAGLPAVVGLYAILVPLVVYALLGSSRQLSVGPESTTALLTAAAIAPLAAGDPARYAALTALLCLLVAGYCVVAWGLRLGFVADLLSRPVLVGYLTVCAHHDRGSAPHPHRRRGRAGFGHAATGVVRSQP